MKNPSGQRQSARLQIGLGAFLAVAGLAVTLITASSSSSSYVLYPFGLVGGGFGLVVRGMFLLDEANLALRGQGGQVATFFDVGLIGRLLIAIGGYKGFVAQRYLLVAKPKVSKITVYALVSIVVLRVLMQVLYGAGFDHLSLKDPVFDANRALELALIVMIVVRVLIYVRPALYTFATGLVMIGVAYGVFQLATHHFLIHFTAEAGIPSWFPLTILIIGAGGAVLAGLALFFGFLRGTFTFFTTVPIGGVWIGTAALVCVLAVMSGFESDLRQKILGSNAHIQITREEGDFSDWHTIYDRVTKMPGIVAATPYAVSEVVIASNNNGLNVIIKGIDPKTVGKVTDLVHDLEDKHAMGDLEPKHDGDLDLKVKPAGRGGVVDPAPAGLPSSGDPIDFSKPKDEPSEASAGSGSAPAPHMATGIAPTIVDDLGSDPDALDPPPPELVTSEAPPFDYSKPRTKGDAVDPQLQLLDFPSEPPQVMKRTESLPGVLVGRELVKQMHLYVGQETRLVSPLSDPSNPDATGTPIPFNRDYRVAGIFFTGMYEYDLKFVYVSLDSLDEFLDRGDAIDGIEVRIGSPDDTDRYVSKISAELGPAYRVVDWKELNRSLFSALKLEKIAMFLVLGIVIIVASFSIIGNLIMVVVEKQREIALLKTLGASDQGIMGLFAIQGLLIGLIGTTLGVATGLAFCYIGKRVGIPLNPDVYYIDKLPVNVDYGSVGWTFFAGVVISIIATFYPAFLGSRVRPATGMRH